MTWTNIGDEWTDTVFELGLSKDADLLRMHALVWCNRKNPVTDGRIPDRALRDVARRIEVDDLDATLSELQSHAMIEAGEDGVWQLDWSGQCSAERHALAKGKEKRKNDTKNDRARRHAAGDHTKCYREFCSEGVDYLNSHNRPPGFTPVVTPGVSGGVSEGVGKVLTPPSSTSPSPVPNPNPVGMKDEGKSEDQEASSPPVAEAPVDSSQELERESLFKFNVIGDESSKDIAILSAAEDVPGIDAETGRRIVANSHRVIEAICNRLTEQGIDVDEPTFRDEAHEASAFFSAPERDSVGTWLETVRSWISELEN